MSPPDGVVVRNRWDGWSCTKVKPQASATTAAVMMASGLGFDNRRNRWPEPGSSGPAGCGSASATGGASASVSRSRSATSGRLIRRPCCPHPRDKTCQRPPVSLSPRSASGGGSQIQEAGQGEPRSVALPPTHVAGRAAPEDDMLAGDEQRDFDELAGPTSRTFHAMTPPSPLVVQLLAGHCHSSARALAALSDSRHATSPRCHRPTVRVKTVAALKVA